MSHALALPANLSLGSIDNYIGSVNVFPRLDAEQETALARRFRDENDLDAARQLVMANLRFVVHIARGYLGYGLPLPDLIQEGNIGLMKAVKRYDPDVGVRLVSFAVHWIRAEIHEFIIQNWRIVKVATTKAQRKLFFNLRKFKNRLGWFSHEEASAVAEDLGLDVDAVYEMENRLAGQDVPFEPLEDEGDERDVLAPAQYLSRSSDDPAYIIADDQWDSRQQARLADALADLDERSRDFLACRWLNEEKSTLHDLAERHRVSAERIRQIENGALKKLRLALAAER
ncbi:MAG: RNA polymerase sigma factor RpoH [Methylococcaceae bacterium]|nr:RNA polymerase sigma factor RpoH [Methylococcaceae bacterium]